MPKIYYRCAKCLKSNLEFVSDFGKTVVFKYVWCKDCETMVTHYKCQHNYWYELLYLTIRDFIRRLK